MPTARDIMHDGLYSTRYPRHRAILAASSGPRGARRSHRQARRDVRPRETAGPNASCDVPKRRARPSRHPAGTDGRRALEDAGARRAFLRPVVGPYPQHPRRPVPRSRPRRALDFPATPRQVTVPAINQCVRPQPHAIEQSALGVDGVEADTTVSRATQALRTSSRPVAVASAPFSATSARPRATR